MILLVNYNMLQGSSKSRCFARNFCFWNFRFLSTDCKNTNKAKVALPEGVCQRLSSDRYRPRSHKSKFCEDTWEKSRVAPKEMGMVCKDE